MSLVTTFPNALAADEAAAHGAMQFAEPNEIFKASSTQAANPTVSG